MAGWSIVASMSLRRRFDLTVRSDVYEVKLDDEYVMSSLFTVAERELARLGLARTPGANLDVLVGGLGHDNCSSTVRSAAMPRAVWLFTAPLLMPMA